MKIVSHTRSLLVHGWECRRKPNVHRPSATSVLRPNVYLRNASHEQNRGLSVLLKIQQRKHRDG
jgi:hypothetical protein